MTDTPRSFAAALSGGPRFAIAVLIALATVLATGCNSAVVTPPAEATPNATSSVGPSGSPKASASPKIDPSGAAIRGFFALVMNDGFSYQATFTGQSRHSTDIFPIRSGLLQVSGDDVLVRATWTLQGHHYAVEHRHVDGKSWVRYDVTDTWHRLGATESMAAFASIRTKADVAYLGPVKVGGKTYYKVEFRSAIVNPVLIPARNLSDTRLTSPKLTLLIDATGRPVKGTAEIDGTGRVSGQLQEIVIDLTVTFTKVGQAVTIKAP